MIEEKARQIGEDVDNTKRSLLTRKGYMEVAMMKSYQSILDGTVVPEPRDVVAMISVMEKMEKDTASVQVDEMMRDFNAFTQSVKEVVGPDMYDRILGKFKNILEQERMVLDHFSDSPKVIETLPSSQPADLEIKEEEVEEGDE